MSPDLVIPFPAEIAAELRADGWPADKPLGWVVNGGFLQEIVTFACQRAHGSTIDPTTLTLTLAAAAGLISQTERPEMRPVALFSVAYAASSAAQMFGQAADDLGLNLQATEMGKPS